MRQALDEGGEEDDEDDDDEEHEGDDGENKASTSEAPHATAIRT